MRIFFRFVLLMLSALPLLSPAQVIPVVPAPAPASLSGVALRDWLRTNWYDPYRVVLSYADARAKMYNYADNYNNSVACVYSGYAETVPFNYNNTSTGVVTNINCEHSIPQSWFNETVRMRSDMHHLYPTYITWNSNRGSDPYAEIPDTQTTLWMRLTQSQTTIPTTNIAEYSEDGPGKFEPREDHKGNLARTAFYFYTMHAGQPDLVATGHNDIATLADLNTLYQWHLADPVDAHELARNQRVAASQGNYNPYIEDPSLVARAWGFAPAGPVISFAAATGSITEGNSGITTYSITVNVNPAPTANLPVQVLLDVPNSTAVIGSDFLYAPVMALTFFPGQTSVTTTLAVTGDTQPEADETVVLTLQNPGTGASIGGPSTHTLTILNDDGPAPTVRFAAATGSIAEGNSGTSTYTTTVTLTNPGTLTFPVTVPVAVVATGTTATSPTDYTLATSTITFTSATALSQPVLVTVVGDLLPEANETVVLRLGTPSNASLVVGTPTTHTLTILNDDATPTGANCSAPYFSKYFESAAGNTKVLEIFNPSNSVLDLSTLRVELFAANATVPTATATLAGTLAAGKTYVIANTGVTDATVRAVANVQSNVCFFNGTQTLVLFDGTDTLDIIGVVGRTPANGATGWAVGGGTTRDNSLVRLPATGRGSSRWLGTGGAATTWQAQGTDNFAGIGSYTSTACATVLAVRSSSTRAVLQVYPNPTGPGTVSVRLPGAASTRLATIEVLDALGRPVRRFTATLGYATPATLELAGLAPGLYAVRVGTVEGQFLSRLVIE